MLSSLLAASRRVFRHISKLEWLVLVGWILYCSWFWIHGLYWNPDGGITAGHPNIWGDGAAHLTMISTTAYRSLIPDTSPLLISYPYSYPFASSLLTGLAVKAGLSLFTAFNLVGWIISLIASITLYIVLKMLTHSANWSLLAIFFFLTNGGLGWTVFIKDIFESKNPLQTFINPPEFYTHMPQIGLDFINIIHSMFFTQRAFTLGLLVGLVAVSLLHLARQKTNRWGLLVVASILFGLLPIIHTHTFLFMFGWLALWAVITTAQKPLDTKSLKREITFWGSLALTSGIISLFLFATFFGENVSNNFIRFAPGWYAPEQGFNPISYWLWNWGIVPFLAPVAVWLWSRKTKLNANNEVIASFGLASIMWFLLGNIFSWQPNLWDNTKLFAWVNLGFSLFLSWLTIYLWQLIKNQRFAFLKKTALIIVIIVTSLSGMMDIYRVARINLHAHQLYAKSELELAAWVRENTSPESIWLVSDQHNHWLTNLTGRQVLMAYRGWLWTHGYNYRPVEQAMAEMFQNPEKNADLFEKYQVEYVVVGPAERVDWSADWQYFDATFEVVQRNTYYTIYQVQ